MAIYDKNRNMLILADNELSINNLLTKEEVYQLGFDAGYDEGYEAGMEECYPDYSKKYFTIEMTSDGSIRCGTIPNDARFDYRVNGGEWNAFITGTYIYVSDGDAIEFRGITNYAGSLFAENAISGSCIAYGNVMSLVYGDDFQDKTTFNSRVACGQLFERCLAITDARNLVLPGMGDACYDRMFADCTNLVAGPEILPAQNLKYACYTGMFRGCSSLVSSPILPATGLAEGCYSSMFINCTALTSITCLAPENFNDDHYTGNWVLLVPQGGTFVKHPDATWPTGNGGIPAGWTVVDAEL